MSEISILMDRDPLLCSDQDITAIVAYTRTQQAQYELGAKAPAAAKKPPKPPKTAALLNELFGSGTDPLDELGLK